MHVPASQACPAPHLCPHAPQLLKSDCVLRHTPEHLVWPDGQGGFVHFPAVQTSPAPHLFPHAPQLDSVGAELHATGRRTERRAGIAGTIACALYADRVRGAEEIAARIGSAGTPTRTAVVHVAGQVSTDTVAVRLTARADSRRRARSRGTHLSGTTRVSARATVRGVDLGVLADRAASRLTGRATAHGRARPRSADLPGRALVSTRTAVRGVGPRVLADPAALCLTARTARRRTRPPNRDLSANTRVSHVPQFAASVCVFVQTSPHRLGLLLGQAIWQTPTPPSSGEQDTPVGHLCPHAPQFFRSLRVSVHTPLQNCTGLAFPTPAGCAQGSWQAPKRHVAPLGHTCPHAPQFAASVCVFVQTSPHRLGLQRRHPWQLGGVVTDSRAAKNGSALISRRSAAFGRFNVPVAMDGEAA